MQKGGSLAIVNIGSVTCYKSIRKEVSVGIMHISLILC